MKFNDTAGTLNMNKTIPSTVTIHFIDGMTQCFEFEAPEIDPMTFASKLEKVLARNQIHIQLVDRVLVIPIQSIKCLEFTPLPPLPSKLPEFVIRNARPISASRATNWNELVTHPAHDRPIRIHDNASADKRPDASIEK